MPQRQVTHGAHNLQNVLVVGMYGYCIVNFQLEKPFVVVVPSPDDESNSLEGGWTASCRLLSVAVESSVVCCVGSVRGTGSASGKVFAFGCGCHRL